ncbi:unnamed protein product, partial [Staurois parvus]
MSCQSAPGRFFGCGLSFLAMKVTSLPSFQHFTPCE